MGYGTGDTGVGATQVFQWTNPSVRYPSKWVITPYLNNTADTGVAVITVYTESDMQNALGKLQKQAVDTKQYDQILVTRYDNIVPSALDTGVGGDKI
jgi:hypothetical protein